MAERGNVVEWVEGAGPPNHGYGRRTALVIRVGWARTNQPGPDDAACRAQRQRERNALALSKSCRAT